MAKKRLDYLSYLLRLWRVNGDRETSCEGKATWRASLESAHTSEKRIFASLDDLFDFLQKQTDMPPARQEDSSHTTR
jgi:hypothetical protein